MYNIVLLEFSGSLFMCCGPKHTSLVDENLISLQSIASLIKQATDNHNYQRLHKYLRG